MSSSHPSGEKVLPEHLVDLVISADARRRQARGGAPARFQPSQRIWIEPFFNFLGWLFGSVLLVLPWPWRRRLDLRLNQLLSGHEPEENAALPGIAAGAAEFARELRRETGQWPATLVLTSHPETEGPLEWLRFEVLRQGLIVAGAVIDAESPRALFRSAPQCFLAIDPYALDTVSPAVGGFYAAWMNRVFIAWDRQPSTQSWIQRHWFLKNSGYDKIVWRLFARLRRNPVLMVLSGGLPHNARLFYAAREFVQRLPCGRRGCSKRLAEKRFMEVVSELSEGSLPHDTGTLSAPTRAKLASLLAEWQVPVDAAGPALKAFEDEFKLELPYRQRFLTVLVECLARRGKPLLLIAVTHRNTAPHVRVATPIAIWNTSSGLKTGTTVGTASPYNAAQFPSEFSKNFSF